MKKAFERLSRTREPINGYTHLAGAIAALAGLVLLLRLGMGEPAKIISGAIYGLCLISMFSASALYHLAVVPAKKLLVLRKLDHAAIFLLIAGTYTPFCVNSFQGFLSWGLLAIIWTVALVGIVVKVVMVGNYRWLNAGLYVVMGWLCVLAAPQMPEVLPASSMTWLIVGGITYTLGAGVYALKLFDLKPGIFGFHEVWHLFVVLGALAHYFAVSLALA